MKNLVIFYSLEGNTKLIASTIARAINADVLELKTKKKYSDKGFKKYFWGGKSVIFKEKPELLEVNKNITLTGISKIDGVQVAYMSASISTDGGNGANVNETITNQEVYNANKAQVRADIAEFKNKVYEMEDELTKVTE